MMRFHLLLVIGFLVPLSAHPAAAGPGMPLLPSASNSTGPEWSPYGKGTISGKNPARECVITAPAVPDETGLFTRVALPPGTAALAVHSDYKANGLVTGEKSWHCGRIRVDFLTSNGAKIGESFAIDRLTGTSPDWVHVTRQFPVPPGAAKATIAYELFLAKSGSIAFRNLGVRALNASEADAWREEADKRINKFRMAGLTIQVVDGAGKPVEGAAVEVRMRRHAYPFGSAVVAKKLTATPETDVQKNYRDVALNFFNYVTLENDLKQGTIGKNTIQPALDALKLLKERGIRARGHVLIWPSWKQVSSALRELKEDPQAVRSWVDNHISATAGATRGLVEDWDVVNEPKVHRDVYELLGKEEVVHWFRQAHAANPDAHLYLNENNVEFGQANQEDMAEWIAFLQAKKAPIHGVGWQAHMWGRTLPFGAAILDDLARYEKFGLKIQVTEYDCNDRFSDADEARFLNEFLPAWFSHPLTSGFIMWGFQDDAIWTKNAPLFARDWSLKPAGKVWMDYIFNRWWTDADGKTGAGGEFRMRGFLGDYAVQVRAGGRFVNAETSLGKDGTTLRVELTDSSPPWQETNRLPDFNPYRAGRLPKILDIPPAPVTAGSKIQVSTDLKTGADASVGGPAPAGASAGLKLHGSAGMKTRQDVFLRFDLSDAPKGTPDGSALVVNSAPLGPAGFAAKVYALSPRFVAARGELDEKWAENLIDPTNAPGRDLAAGDYRLGDASLIFLGDWSGALNNGSLRWESGELTSAIGRAIGSTLTLVIVPEDGVDAEFRSKEFSSADAPTLELHYP